MVNKTDVKNGFSLAEALVSMLIMSIFFIATVKVMTNRQPRDTERVAHGFYECYIGNGALAQTQASNGITPQTESGISNCIFNPPRGVAQVVLYAVTVDENGNSVINNFVEQMSGEMTINRTELENINERFGETKPNSFELPDLGRYLELSYKDSELGRLIRAGSYNSLPALFIGW